MPKREINYITVYCFTVYSFVSCVACGGCAGCGARTAPHPVPDGAGLLLQDTAPHAQELECSTQHRHPATSTR